MRRIFLISFILTIVFHFRTFTQDKEVTTTEKVSVVNVEVPVRVFFKGIPIENLNKNNFSIFEDGKRQEINGFYMKRKKIKSFQPDSNMTKPESLPKSRYFVLVFQITKYNDQLEKGLDYLFENIFIKNDQLRVFVNNRSLFFNQLSNMNNAKDQLKKILQQESQLARQQLLTYQKKIEDELNLSRLKSLLEKSDYHTPDEIIHFLQKYILLWEEYNRNYLMPNIDNYYNFSLHLEKINKEKWVISFYQIEMFPKLRLTGSTMEDIEGLIGGLQSSSRSEDLVKAQTIMSLLRDIDKALFTSKDFPAEEISKLFYKVDTTFHSILMHVNQELLSQDLEYKKVSTEIENSLRELSKKTGGSLQATGNLESAMEKIKDQEDITYMLTYAPTHPEKVGKIKVIVDNKNYSILYDDQMRADYIQDYLKKKKLEIPDIQIQKTKFEKKALSLLVTDFLLKNQNNTMEGQIYVEIKIMDSNNKNLYDQKKIITSKQDSFSISIEFPWLKTGRYDVILQVTDILTGKSTSDFLQPVIY